MNTYSQLPTVEVKTKHVDLSPPFQVEIGVIGLILIAYVIYRVLWG